MPAPTPVLIDTDPGIDDAVALALAVRSPELQLVGVTATYGNADLSRTYRNARQALDLAGATDVPLHPGASTPLRRSADVPPGRHGPEGVGAATVVSARPVDGDPKALLHLLEGARQAVTIALLGPPTALALALECDEPLVRMKVARVVAMLGNLGAAESPERHADFNAWCDPDAASRVLQSGLPLELVPANVAKRFASSREDLTAWGRAADPLTQWLAAAVGWRWHAGDESTAVLPDVTAVATLIDPRTVTLAERRLSIDLDEGVSRGRTHERGKGAVVAVATGVATTRVRALLTRIGDGGRTAATGEETQ